MKFGDLCNVLKESISNGIRHGKATAFWVELKSEESYVRLLISDNGSGADLRTLKKGFGLSAMTESAERLGGIIELSSALEDGLELTASIPIDTPSCHSNA